MLGTAAIWRTGWSWRIWHQDSPLNPGQAGGGCWQEASVPSHVDFFIKLLQCFHDVVSDFPLSNPREHRVQPHGFYYPPSEVVYHHFYTIPLVITGQPYTTGDMRITAGCLRGCYHNVQTRTTTYCLEGISAATINMEIFQRVYVLIGIPLRNQFCIFFSLAKCNLIKTTGFSMVYSSSFPLHSVGQTSSYQVLRKAQILCWKSQSMLQKN